MQWSGQEMWCALGEIVRVTVLKAIPEDLGLGAAWNSLVLGMENPEVFFTHQWALAVSRGFRQNQCPMLFLIYDSDQLAGVAALVVDSREPRAASFLASSTADYCDIVSAPENRGAVLDALLVELQDLGFRDLVFASIPSTSATLTHLDEAAGTSGFYVATHASSECGIVELGDAQQRKVLVQAVSAKNREKRGLKKLSAVGPVSVVQVAEPRQIQDALEAIVSAQVSRFLASGRVSPLLDPERRAFLTELGDLLAQAGWLKISQLAVNGRPIAWNYGFCFEGSWFWYLPSFRIEYEHTSPGSCLLRLLVEEACADSTLRWLDLGLGDESYKVRFANNVRQTRYVQLSRSWHKHVVKAGRQKLAVALALSPNLEGKIREARQLYRSIAGRVHDTGMVPTMQHAMRRAIRLFASRSEVLIFQASGKETGDGTADRVVPMNTEHMVRASIRNDADSDTLAYLMRCAKRMSHPGVSGFVLQDEADRSTNFLWIANYDGFHISEIDHTLEALSQDAAMIFDCWTPAADRGHGYYAIAVRSAAASLRREGKTAWIFSDAKNASSVHGILKAGFAYRFSLVRRSWFRRSTVVRCETTTAI